MKLKSKANLLMDETQQIINIFMSNTGNSGVIQKGFTCNHTLGKVALLNVFNRAEMIQGKGEFTEAKPTSSSLQLVFLTPTCLSKQRNSQTYLMPQYLVVGV